MRQIKVETGRDYIRREAITIATYVISDIHGEYDMFLELLEKIKLKKTDTLYVLGDELDEEMLDNLVTWQYNGSKTTIDEFGELDSDTKQDVIDFIKDFLIYEEVTIKDKNYLLVHAGLGNFAPEKDIEDYSLHDLIWMRADYEITYFDDAYVITGHTPTQNIEGNPNPGFIYMHNNHIAIDCGACFPGGRLAAICLDTGEAFYSSINKMADSK